jgi:Flp pilus assembly protein TadG
MGNGSVTDFSGMDRQGACSMIRDEKGGSLVEFAIILPLLLVMLFGIIELGILLYNQAVITNASREGARYGIVARNPRWTEAEILGVVRDFCDRELITFGDQNAPSVTATPLDGTTDFGDDLAVQVNWIHTFLVLPNFPEIGLSNSLTLSARTVMKYE